MSSWAGSNAHTVNLAPSNSFGAHAADAVPPAAGAKDEKRAQGCETAAHGAAQPRFARRRIEALAARHLNIERFTACDTTVPA